MFIIIYLLIIDYISRQDKDLFQIDSLLHRSAK